MACPNQQFYYDQYGYGYPVYTYATYPLATYTTTAPQQQQAAQSSSTQQQQPPTQNQTANQNFETPIMYEQYPAYLSEYPYYSNPNSNNSNNVAPCEQPIITVGSVNLQKPSKTAPLPPPPVKPTSSRLQPPNEEDQANQIKSVVEMALSNSGLSKVILFFDFDHFYPI